VSAGTVSNVYNRPEVVREELRTRVLESAARLGFGGADPIGRNLRRGRAQALGIVMRERLAYAFEDMAAVEVLQGVSDAADPHELGLLILPAYPDRAAVTRGSGVRNAAVDGFVLYSLVGDDPLLDAVQQRRLPAVIIDAPAPPPDGFSFVGVDDYRVGRAAAEHLLRLGHRDIGVLSLRLSAHDRPGIASLDVQAGSTSHVARSRLAGAADALRAVGTDWRDVLVVRSTISSVAEGRTATRVLLDNAPAVTAVLALSDSLALGALAEARGRGLTVPVDLSVIGVDDTAPEAAQLTTIRQPHREKGRTATEMLIRSIDERPAPLPPRLLRTELVVRGTTAAPPPRAQP